MDINTREALISVIVPIYNVEKYVKKCLDSLQKQSLKQIEIIMIDDGSTDQSGEIAEKYVTKGDQWPVFRCIHTPNRGLSAARNRGIEEVQTEWLMFVDSDDWVEPGYCEIPYKAAIENGADMVIFKSYKEIRGKIYKDNKNIIPQEGIIDAFTAFEYGRNEAWNKLYKRNLFEMIQYPEGRVHEDIAITHKLEHMAKPIVYISDSLYCHVKRKNSISSTRSEAYRRDELISTKERYNDYISYGFPKEKHIHYLYSAAIGYLASTRPINTDLYKEAKTIVNSINGIPEKISKNRKIALATWKTNKILFYFICKISGRI